MHLYTLFLILYLLLALGLFTFMLSTLIGFFLTRVPLVNTSSKDLEEIFSLLDLKAGDAFKDLGCGTGKTVFYFASKGINSNGYELVLWAFVFAKIKSLFRSNANFFFKDFRKISFKDTDGFYAYLFPELLPPIEFKIRNECKPGTKIVTRDFFFKEWEPVKFVTSKSGHTLALYIL